MMEGCSKLPDQQRPAVAKFESCSRLLVALATYGPKSSTVTETGCGSDTVDQVGRRPIIVNKMHK